jgi:hypothetical protein
MGNWHCIPSSCAEVVYQPYESQKVRWQYPGEPWQEIIGADDYSLTPVYSTRVRYQWQYDISQMIASYSGANINSPSQACGGKTGLHRQCVDVSRRTWDGGFDACRLISVVYAPIYSYRVSDFHTSDYPCLSFNVHPCKYPAGWRVIQVLCHGGASYSATPVWVTLFDGKRYTSGNGAMLQFTNGGDFGISYDTSTDRYSFNQASNPDWQYFRFVNFDNRPPTQCQFKVFKNGQIVHQETRAVCPTVEKIPCSLVGVPKTIEIKKTPYLDRVDLVNKSVEQIYLPPSNTPVLEVKDLAPQCLNVYLTYILAPPLLTSAIPSPGFNPYQFIAQICSAPGCPPPEYQVTCDSCGCESCPGDTCPVECNGVICCYNDYGTSVKEIPLANYCGG